MKQAKLLLSLIGMAAILSTIFAFEAHTFSQHWIYTGNIHQDEGGTACTTLTSGAAITGGTPNVRASTISLNYSCPPVYSIAVMD